MKVTVCLAAALTVWSVAAAHASTVVSPYLGEERREIKSMSPEELESLLSGKGMGFAKAAELNGYPGPSHVLQLASELRLTAAQKAQTQALFEAMELKAKALGARLVDAERKLDQLFASRHATAEALAKNLAEIGSLQAQVRGAHLEAHLTQTQLLSTEQVALYNKLRGYAADSKSQGGHSHKH